MASKTKAPASPGLRHFSSVVSIALSVVSIALSVVSIALSVVIIAPSVVIIAPSVVIPSVARDQHSPILRTLIATHRQRSIRPRLLDHLERLLQLRSREYLIRILFGTAHVAPQCVERTLDYWIRWLGKVAP